LRRGLLSSAFFSMLLKKMHFSEPLVSVITRLQRKPLVFAGTMHWKTMYLWTRLRRSGAFGRLACDVTVMKSPRLMESYCRLTPFCSQTRVHRMRRVSGGRGNGAIPVPELCCALSSRSAPWS